MELCESESSLAGRDVRVVPHIITKQSSSTRRLGIHLVEVVDHPKADFTTVSRPLMLKYRVKSQHFEDRERTKSGFSRPLDDVFFSNGRFLSEFVELVDKSTREATLRT